MIKLASLFVHVNIEEPDRLCIRWLSLSTRQTCVEMEIRHTVSQDEESKCVGFVGENFTEEMLSKGGELSACWSVDLIVSKNRI